MEKRNIIFALVIFVALCVFSVMIIYFPAVTRSKSNNVVNETVVEKEAVIPESTPEKETEVVSEENVNAEEEIAVPVSEESVLDKINNAESVTIREKIISLNKSYDIYVNGSVIANVSGKYISLTGDVFSLKDNSGNTLLSEKQIKRWGIKLNRAAQIYDADGNTIRLLW